MKKFITFLVSVFAFISIGLFALTTSHYRNLAVQGNDLVRKLENENEALKQILRGEFDRGNNACSSIELLIQCYDEVNKLRSLNSSHLN